MSPRRRSIAGADATPLVDTATCRHAGHTPTVAARTLSLRIVHSGLLALLVGTCASCGTPGEHPPEESSPLRATAFRIRAAMDAPLNQDLGWAAPAGRPAVVAVDRPFRIRLEVEAPSGTEGELPTRFTLQARRDDGGWQTLLLRDFPYPDELSTPPVSLVRVDRWGSGAPTGDLLAGSDVPFVPGEGVSDPLRTDAEGDALEPDDAASPWPAEGVAPDDGRSPLPVHGEWEWPVVIRRWADGAVTSEAGDVLDFRMLDGAGRPVAGAGPVRVTLQIPAGHLGGTYVETPGVLGPWQSADGTLYFPMEPAETFNVLMMVASTDHGDSWTEVDGTARPATGDLEGFATAWHDGVVYLLHQISEATYLHVFDTTAGPAGVSGAATGASDPTGNPSPTAAPSGRWVVRDELVATHSEPPTQVAALVARGDGSLVALYGDAAGLRYRVRSAAGSWAAEGRVEVSGGGLASGVMAVRAAGDVVHVAYTVTAPDGSARSVWHRTFSASGGPSPATRLGDGVGTAEDEIGALLPLGWLPDEGSVVVAWRRADGTLWERRVHADGGISDPSRITSRPVVQSGADSEQVGADLVVHDGVVHVVFIDEEARDLWHTSSAEPGVWTPARPVVEGIDAQWVRGRVVRDASGAPRYGLVYDAGSDGGSGMNRYHAMPLREPAADSTTPASGDETPFR